MDGQYLCKDLEKGLDGCLGVIIFVEALRSMQVLFYLTSDIPKISSRRERVIMCRPQGFNECP